MLDWSASLDCSSIDERVQIPIQDMRSDWGGGQRVVTPGGWWVINMTFDALDMSGYRTLKSLVEYGKRGVLRIPAFWALNGFFSGSPVVNGFGQTGTSLVISGVASSAVPPGNWFSVEDGLKRVVHHVGNVLTFEPPLSSSPPNGVPLDFSSPKGKFQVVSENLVLRGGGIGSGGVSLVEVV